MIKKLGIALLALCMLLSLASVFAYAAFDYSWWTPIDHEKFGGATRSLFLMLIHVLCVVGPIGGILVLSEKK